MGSQTKKITFEDAFSQTIQVKFKDTTSQIEEDPTINTMKRYVSYPFLQSYKSKA